MCKCWSQWLLIAVIFAFSMMTLFSLSGCGIKGPLYMPGEEKKKQEKPLKKEAEKTAKQIVMPAKEK